MEGGKISKQSTQNLSAKKNLQPCIFLFTVQTVISRLQELLDERGIKLFPGDKRQLLMLLRATRNSDPELAVDVAKKYIAFSRYVLQCACLL